MKEIDLKNSLPASSNFLSDCTRVTMISGLNTPSRYKMTGHVQHSGVEKQVP